MNKIMKEQNESADERHHRLVWEAERKRMRQENEMVDQLKHRLAQDAARKRMRQDNEMADQLQLRLAQDAARKRMRWENEMTDQLQHRLARNAEQRRLWRAWELCLESLVKQEGVLGVTHAYRLCVLNAALSAACHLSTDKALSLVTQATNSFRKLGLSWAPKVVSVFMKAAAVACIYGELEEGHGLLCEVLSVLLSTHGALHPRTKHVQALCWGLERKMKVSGQSVRIQDLPDQDGELMREALKASMQPPEKTIFFRIY
uniref:Uncharacterized protein n=1 Tax=Eptatretus burgeri TaxID=7764 RepID=A0A8C4QYE2_EPTBU